MAGITGRALAEAMESAKNLEPGYREIKLLPYRRGPETISIAMREG
jgi:hypothetical protein